MLLKRFPRYTQVALVLWKHGRGKLFAEASELFGSTQERLPEGEGSPEGITEDLEKLGPTFVKLGQLMSTRADLLPRAYREALERLQDDVEPFAFEEIEKIVHGELGVRISKAFLSFDEEPLGAASLGQVHRATLRSGREVAVKVQRPGIRPQIVEDLEMLGELAELLDGRSEQWRHLDLPKMVDDLRRSLLAELDYKQEADNLMRLRLNLDHYKLLLIPEPILDYSTSKVLTMQYLSGTKIPDLNPVALIDVDGEALVTELFRAYLDQVLVDGFFHADPHPGNLLMTSDHRIAVLDLGMVARVSQGFREKLLLMLMAISDGQGSVAATIAIGMGEPFEGFDENAFRQQVEALVEDVGDRPVVPERVSDILLSLSRIAGDCGIRMPREVVLLGKTLLHLDDLSEYLAPRFDANAVIREHASSITKGQLRETWSPTAILSRLMEIKDLAEAFPRRLNSLMTTLTDKGLRVDIDALDEGLLIRGFQKIANRIASGLILAALIIGAAMMMQVPSSFQILGYPGLAMILFMLAVAGGAALLWSIVKSDRSS